MSATVLVTLIMITVLVLLCLVPWFVACARESDNRTVVLIICLFFGWTMIGWVVALCMAVAKKPSPQIIVISKE